MSYYISKKVDYTFDEAIEKITSKLQDEGFGIVTEINISNTFKMKLDVDFRNYRILGACNPGFAHKALGFEDKIGTMLPCNVIVQETEDGKCEIAAVDPVASMMAVDNNGVKEIAGIIKEKLQNAIEKV